MKSLINRNILDLQPYQAGKPIDEIRRKFALDKIVKLASNENPFPIPENVKESICEQLDMVNRYPASDSYYLKNGIAEYNGVEPENVLVGAGSVEIIKMIVKTFIKPGEKVITSEKSFLMYKIATIENFGKESYIEIPMDDKFRFDLDAINDALKDDVKVIFLTNPNNPTGTEIESKKIIDFIEKVPESKIIVLDNAYQEYVEDQDNYFNALDMVKTKKNLIILRTFSKIYGLAGLRVGYAVGSKDIISYLGRVKPPFNVTRLAQNAALESLKNDDFKLYSYKKNLENKKKLIENLIELKVNVIPSETNFLMFFPDTDIDRLNDNLLKEGVIIRPLKAFGVPDAMRVTVGTQEDNDFFIRILKKYL